jgi:hypothetical protein
MAPMGGMRAAAIGRPGWGGSAVRPGWGGGWRAAGAVAGDGVGQLQQASRPVSPLLLLGLGAAAVVRIERLDVGERLWWLGPYGYGYGW